MVVASTSGETREKFVEALRVKAKGVAISHEKVNPELKEENG